MGLLDVLGNYRQLQDRPAPQVFEDFDRVAQEADADEIGGGLADALNSDDTPPAEQMVGQLYERSDPHTRAGFLKEILGLSPKNAQDVPVRDVEAATAEAARRNPGVIETISRFYAQHPQLVQTLGQAALSILMSGMARRRRA